MDAVQSVYLLKYKKIKDCAPGLDLFWAQKNSPIFFLINKIKNKKRQIVTIKRERREGEKDENDKWEERNDRKRTT
jgi:hypothetical protein